MGLLSLHSWLKAQCIATSQYPSSTVAINSSTPTTISSCNFAGEYAVINFTATGAYTINASGGSGNYITLTDASNTPLYFGTAPLSVTISASGVYRAHFTTNSACGTEASCRTTFVIPFGYTPPPPGPCIQTSQYPSSTITVSSTNTTQISTCNFAGEYAAVNFTATGIYSISATGGTGNYITFTDASNTPILYGNSPITVTITTPGIYRVHFSQNSACATENSCRNTMITPNTYTPPPPPANDDCVNAQSLTVPGTYTGTTINATTETVTIPTCTTSVSQPGVWYTVTGNGSIYLASLCGTTSWDSKIFVYSGNCSALISIGCNDDNGPGCNSTAASYTWSTTNGTTYYILVTGFSTASDFTLNLNTYTPPSPPANDDCANAQPLTVPGTYTGTTIGATPEPTTVPTCSVTSLTQPGVWYSVTGDGSAFLASLCGTSLSWDSKIFVYAGNNCNSLASVGCNDDSGPDCSGLLSSIAWCTTPGTTYYILVTGYATSSDFTLSISSFTPSFTYSLSNTALCAGNPANSATIFLTPIPSDNSIWTFSVNPGNYMTIASPYSVTITPSVTTNYTLSGINNDYFMCPIISLTTNMVVNPSPTITVNSATVCSGQSTTLIANGAMSYTWSSGQNSNSIVITPTTTTTFTVMGTDMSGCTDTETTAINVLPNPSASVSVTNATTPGCTNGSATLNVSGNAPFTYSWTPNVSTTNTATNLNGTMGGYNYTVVISDANNCKTSVSFSVDCVTGINTISNSDIVKLLPNPNNGLFYIQNTMSGHTQYYLLDLTGRVIRSFVNNSNNVEVNISDLSQGMYIIKITNGQTVIQLPVIKNQ